MAKISERIKNFFKKLEKNYAKNSQNRNKKIES